MKVKTTLVHFPNESPFISNYAVSNICTVLYSIISNTKYQRKKREYLFCIGTSTTNCSKNNILWYTCGIFIFMLKCCSDNSSCFPWKSGKNGEFYETKLSIIFMYTAVYAGFTAIRLWSAIPAQFWQNFRLRRINLQIGFLF